MSLSITLMILWMRFAWLKYEQRPDPALNFSLFAPSPTPLFSALIYTQWREFYPGHMTARAWSSFSSPSQYMKSSSGNVSKIVSLAQSAPPPSPPFPRSTHKSVTSRLWCKIVSNDKLLIFLLTWVFICTPRKWLCLMYWLLLLSD